MNETDILIEAKNIINLEGWTQGSLCREASGAPGNLTDPRTVSFCSMGGIYEAIMRAGLNTVETGPVFDLFVEANGLESDTKLHPIAAFNDSCITTKEMVLDAFDKAIAYSKDNHENV